MEGNELGFPIISTDNIRFSDWCFASLKNDGKWYVRRIRSGEDPASLEFSSNQTVISQNDFRVGDVGYLKILENSIFIGKNSVVLVKDKKEPQKESILAPRTECDHIVGFLSNNQDGGAAPIHQSDSMAKVLEASELLKYCPECGEKLNLK